MSSQGTDERRAVYGVELRNQKEQTVKDRLFRALSNNRAMILLTVVPVLVLFFLINLLPMIWAFWASLYEISIFSPDWTWTGYENYLSILTGEEFWQSFKRSVIFAGGSVAIQIVAGTALALLISKNFKFERFVRAMVLLPYLIPTAILGFIALWMGNSQWGIINLILVDLGIFERPQPWFGSLDLAMPAVILTNSWKFTIFVTIMVLARLQSINEGFYEAAEMAGANAYQKFRDITYPNIKGILLIVILLRGIWMFNKFDIIWVLTQGGPGDVTTTLPIYGYQVAFSNTQLGKASAVSVLMFVILLIVAMVYFTVFKPEQEVRVE